MLQMMVKDQYLQLTYVCVTRFRLCIHVRPTVRFTAQQGVASFDLGPKFPFSLNQNITSGFRSQTHFVQQTLLKHMFTMS